MNNGILGLKSRVFNTKLLDEPILSNSSQSFQKDKDKYLEEILESLSNQNTNQDFVVFNALEKKVKSVKQLEEQSLWIDEKKVDENAKMVFYQLSDNLYYVYTRSKTPIVYSNVAPKIPIDPDLQQSIGGLFVPSGVMIRRVSQNILGTGVLGRAFLGMNYIEILDSLSGNAYQEVLTHEVLHIIHPQKKEMEIRHMTRNYVGPKNTIYH